MVQESSILEKDFIFLVQTKNKDLERLLSHSVKDEKIRLESVESSTDISEKKPAAKILAFIIGSDVEDPIQSAQRLHAFQKSAKIILLAASENIEFLKEAIKYSPFIGTEIFCLEESREEKLEKKLKEILQDTLQAEKYRAIIAETNSQISLKTPSQKSPFNQNFISKLMDVAPIGLAIVGQKGTVLGWNKEAALTFKKSESQVLGTPLSHLFDQLEGDKLEEYVKKSFEKGKAGSVGPLSLERDFPDQTKQILSFTAARFTYSGGREKALILAIKDITDNIELLNQLQTEVTARDNFLGMASHELRTPLTSMRINLELLRKSVERDFPDASRLLKLNDKSLKQAVRLNELIEDLFDITKIHSGKLDFNLEEFNLSEFVEHYMTEMESKFREVNSEAELDIEPDVTGVWDKDRIEQAFANVISNTLKYAPDAPVKVVLRTTGDSVLLSVEDQGPGISEEKQEIVFERFERATASKNISGLGLGLFITKKIVEGHGGTVRIQSSSGKGATFILKLPLNLDPRDPPEGLGVLW